MTAPAAPEPCPHGTTGSVCSRCDAEMIDKSPAPATQFTTGVPGINGFPTRAAQPAPDAVPPFKRPLPWEGGLPVPGDWPEDFAHENGQYYCRCCECNRAFLGHKRRVVCKVCVDTREKGSQYGQGVADGGLRENHREVPQAQRPDPKTVASVPRDPTQAMIAACRAQLNAYFNHDGMDSTICALWHAMHDAATGGK